MQETLDSSTDPDNDTPELLKAALNFVVADEQHLDGPVDLTHKATAQASLYTHTDVRTAKPLAIDGGAELLVPPSTSQ